MSIGYLLWHRWGIFSYVIKVPNMLTNFKYQFSSGTQLYLTVCNPMDCSTPGFPVCREPEWGTLPVAKVMRKEARHMQRRDRASGVPLEIRAPTPKPESAYFTALCSHLHLWLYGGLSPTTSLWKRVNLQLRLIKFLGVTRVFKPTNSFGSPLACLNRFFWPHVIVHSLPTMRGMRCSKLLNTDSFKQLKDWLKIVLVKGFSLVGPLFAAKFPYPLPTVFLGEYWLIGM